MAHLSEDNLNKLNALNNQKLIKIVNEYVDLLKPSNIFVITDEEKDVKFVREQAIKTNEEAALKTQGHTIHYDSFYDQARDKENTRILVTPDISMSNRLNTLDRKKGLSEILGILDGAMNGKDMIIRFFSLGPINSIFSICALQITDSWYVAHSEDILYRKGYEQFKNLNATDDFFILVHSAGELTKNVTNNIDKRRIYIDLVGNRVLSVNNQYAGNSLGLKKLALRLAMYKSNHEDWLTEHMFIMGIHPPKKERITYVAGAYPSACGKTSTAMIPGQTIVGDDIAYLRIINNECRGANIEQGLFGIIRDVNQRDDPVIFNTLKTKRELIFSNVLINNGLAYWTGMGETLPDEGTNHSGDNWTIGKKDKNKKDIPPSHPNARFTVRISALENVDPNLHNPEGVKIQGLFYGGRDSDTNVPIYEGKSWEHGIFIGATIESETTSATLGKAGVRKNSPMANMDFLVIPLGLYFSNHKNFGEKLGKNCPKVFATNYFLKSDGKYTNEKVDKKIWILWAEGRIHGDYKAIKTPIGNIPEFKDLNQLFKQTFNREYSKDEYIEQFSIRISKYLEKLERMESLFENEPNMPEFFWEILKNLKSELLDLKNEKKQETVSPFDFK